MDLIELLSIGAEKFETKSVRMANKKGYSKQTIHNS